MIDQYAPNTLPTGAVLAADGLLAPRKWLRHHRRDVKSCTCQWNTGCCQMREVIFDITIHTAKFVLLKLMPKNGRLMNIMYTIDEYIAKTSTTSKLAANVTSEIVNCCRQSVLRLLHMKYRHFMCIIILSEWMELWLFA